MLSHDQKVGFARQLKANPLWQEILSSLEAKALSKWRGASADDDHKRSEAWYEDRARLMIERQVDELAADLPLEQQEDES